MTKEQFIQEAIDFGFKKDLRSNYHRYNYGPKICVILSDFPDEPKVRFWGTEEMRRKNEHLEIDDYTDGWLKIQMLVVFDS